MGDIRGIFFSAAEVAAGVLRSPAVAARWTEPSALPGLTVGGLAGHLLRAVARLDRLLDAEPPPGPTATAGAYYGNAKLVAGSSQSDALHAGIRADGEQAATAGPDGVATAFDDLLAELRVRLADTDASRTVAVLTIPGHTATIDEYLRTRVVELVAHTDDLCASVGLDTALPPEALAVAVETLVDVVRAREGDLGVLRGLCRPERVSPEVLRAL